MGTIPRPSESLSSAEQPKQKTREEYLVRYEDRLLVALAEGYTAVNRNLALSYGTVVLVGLVYWKTISKLSIGGAEVSLNPQYVPFVAPIILMIITALMNRDLITISMIIGQIRSNGDEILGINGTARPVSIKTLHLFAPGVTGMILSVARWQTWRIARTAPSEPVGLPLSWKGVVKLFVEIRSILYWCINTATRVCVLLALFLAPLCAMAFYLHELNTTAGQLRITLLFILLLLFGVGTAMSGVAVFASYSMDYIDAIKADFKHVGGEVDAYAGTIKTLVHLMNTTLRIRV